MHHVNETLENCKQANTEAKMKEASAWQAWAYMKAAIPENLPDEEKERNAIIQDWCDKLYQPIMERMLTEQRIERSGGSDKVKYPKTSCVLAYV
jgi:hypothetical protein